MKTLDKNSFLQLANNRSRHCISIYMPTHKLGQEVLERQDAIIFKNNLQQIQAELERTELKPNEIQAMLKPAFDLLDDREFWRQQDEGLAVFIKQGFFEYFSSPIRFDEFKLVSQSFHVKPLIPLVGTDYKYYLLKLSKKEPEFYEATRFKINKIDISHLAPSSFEEQLMEYDIHGIIKSRGMTGQFGGDATPHGNNNLNTKEKNHLLFEYFRKINDGIFKLIGHTNCPLIVAGVEYFHPIYKEANTYPHLMSQGLIGNYDRHTQVKELHLLSRDIVAPVFMEPKKKRIEQFMNLSGSDKISIDINEILKSAATGRVDTLFVSKEANIWGKFDEEDLDVAVHSDFQEHDECLLDKATVKALENGGEVYLSDNGMSELALDVPIAAIFRY